MPTEILLTVEKQTIEKFTIAVNFAALLATGETISSQSATSKNRSTLADTTATMISGSAALDDITWVVATIHQGTSGDSHLVTLSATTSLGYVRAGTILVVVEDPA
jgi:hypothetical protein